MKRLIAAVLILGIFCSLLPSVMLKAEAATFDYESGLWNIDGKYRQLRPDLTKGGYWNSTSSANYNKVIKDESNSPQFFATPRFTKSQLPIGSVIVIEDGWQYRPEGWVNDVVQSSRPNATTQKYIEVTSDWWSP